ncbi:MAG TPA: MarR family transcriptional regulator, partial [Kribbellaceae bacterium]|nr:MarR family transcriptional regulator [Kribbellaceae bacterium]
MDDAVSRVRAFTRYYTGAVGALQEGLLRSPYSLTEARVLFELGRRESVDAIELRRMLDLDAGYLSRMLARFEADKLLTRERSETDGRRQVIRLTAQGRAAYTELDDASAAEVAQLLDPLTAEDRRELVQA